MLLAGRLWSDQVARHVQRSEASREIDYPRCLRHRRYDQLPGFRSIEDVPFTCCASAAFRFGIRISLAATSLGFGIFLVLS